MTENPISLQIEAIVSEIKSDYNQGGENRSRETELAGNVRTGLADVIKTMDDWFVSAGENENRISAAQHNANLLAEKALQKIYGFYSEDWQKKVFKNTIMDIADDNEGVIGETLFNKIESLDKPEEGK